MLKLSLNLSKDFQERFLLGQRYENLGAPGIEGSFQYVKRTRGVVSCRGKVWRVGTSVTSGDFSPTFESAEKLPVYSNLTPYPLLELGCLRALCSSARRSERRRHGRATALDTVSTQCYGRPESMRIMIVKSRKDYRHYQDHHRSNKYHHVISVQ